MTVGPPLSRLNVAYQLAAHLGQRDFDKVVDLLSQDVTYRVGGNHTLAGTFRGPVQVVAHVRQLVERTGDTYDAFKWDDWLVGAHHVAGLVRIHAHGHAAVYSGKLVVLFGFDPADKVCEITVLFEDAGGAERFFGR